MKVLSELQHKLIIGVTGGIGAGKTAATDAFAELGIAVVDADLVAREVVEPGSSVLEQIRVYFGDDILLADGNLNRAKLRQIIFSDVAQKNWLNQLMHPAIRQALVAQLELAAAESPYVILSAPLLLENELEIMVDRVLVVDVNEEVQLQRASGRDGVNESQIQAIIDSQISRPERLAKADDVIDNSKDLKCLIEQVKRFHKKYLELTN